MKYTKKILALLLALTMMFAMAVNVWADETVKAGSITIDNAVKGKNYTIYRIFDVNSHNTDYTAFNYTVSSKWTGFFAEDAAGLNYVDIDKQYGYVTWKASASAADFAAAAIQYAETNSIAHDGTTPATGSSVQFTGLDLGYYLVKSDLGALCSLDTTTPNVTIKEKNAEPTIAKVVQEDSDSKWGKKNDADLGQTVNYKTTINVIDGQPVKYILHDKMTGLTFKEVTSITVKRGSEDVALESGKDYTVKTTGLTDGCAFEVHFTDNTTDGVTSSVLKPNDVVTVEYSATVNADAVIAGTGNPNETWLNYGENGRTEKHETRTYVWEMKVFKYTVKGDQKTETPLAGAEFKLYKTEGEQKKYATASEIRGGDGKLTGYKVTGWTATESNGTTFVSPETGKFDIVGLDADTYKLEETKAPAGYNKLAGEINVVITREYSNSDNTGTATVTYGENSTGEVKVLNQTGTELPSTGGMGTTIFYILGSALVLAAGVLLVTKKRMSTEG